MALGSRGHTAVWKRKSTAFIAGAVCVAGLAVLIGLASSFGGSSGTYQVRAIFDDADNIIGGEDVKIDGVKVGSVGSVTPTPQATAAVVLDISNPGFKNFREDATCSLRPQSLIGEKFVDCLPTQTRVEGTPEPPPLKKIGKGQEGEGEYLLPVKNTHSPIDQDLLLDIWHLPVAQRFTIIINELGAGLAGRASDLKEVVERADPALQETNKVLGILANENKVLVNLAEESDKALKPFAAVRNEVADFIVQSNTVARASALHRGAIAKNFEDFPPFLKELGPAMERLGKLAEQTEPTFKDLKVAAPGINATFTHLAGFSHSSEKFFESFGKTAHISGPALKASEPLESDLQALGESAKPFAGNFSQLLSSFRETGGIERIMDFIFLGAGSSNGYDALGHFLRAEGVANLCLTYSLKPVGVSCNSKFVNLGPTSSTTTAKSSSIPNQSSTSLVMDRTLAVLKGATPAQAIREFPGSISSGAGATAPESGAQTTQPVGGAAAKTTYYTPPAEESTGGALLNYLLGD
jgi:phospholipid/cholesterol/gamma-HCH transport system substrate-binding protein